MDTCNIVENIYLLAIITALSVLQNAGDCFIVSCGNAILVCCNLCSYLYFLSRNCVDSYPTFMAVMWCAGVCLNQAPAAFAGLLYLVVRHKYFIGYMGQTSQSTPGYLFGKRILFFLVLMCLIGILNYLLTRYFGSDYRETVETFTSAASTLLLIP
uniref:Uncharacterized protein n=1 Tax=Periophthalmus magnuspinnatus TaxID=409849 RepID=A0A3B3Z7V9_9GOBI